MSYFRAMFLLAAATVSSVAAASDPSTSRVLVPLAVRSLEGAHGARWETRIVVLQEVGELVIRGFDYRTECPGPCGIPSIPVANVPFQPQFFASAPDEPPGLVLHISTERAGATHISATAYDASRPDGAATSLPVVPESDFSAAPDYFVDVRARRHERLMLRVYSLDVERTAPRVRLQVIARGELGAVIAERTREVTLSVRQRYTEVLGRYPIRPLAAQIALSELFDGGVVPDVPLTIVVTPLDGLRTWSFLSTTDNVSQHTTVTLPQ